MAKSRTSFARGRSGNPGGRPRTIAEVRRLAQKHSTKAIARAAELLESPDGKVALAAAHLLLDRAWGKPTQEIELTATTETKADLSKYTLDELKQIRAIQRAAVERKKEEEAKCTQ